MTARSRAQSVILSPLLALALSVIAFDAATIALQVTNACPKSPWDSGLVIAAERVREGRPLYGDAVTDQASTMYGPLVPAVLSVGFRLFGPSNSLGKWLSFSAALAALALTLRVTARHNPLAWLLGSALLMSAHHSSEFFFTETRPDAVATFLALSAVALAYQWNRRGELRYLLASTPLFVAAFLAKQPLAAAALIPLIATALGQRRDGLVRRLALAGLPLAVIVAVAVLIRAVAPAAYLYMFTLPARYAVSPTLALRLAVECVAASGLVLAALLDIAVAPRPTPTMERWWATATGVFFAAGVLAMAKTGGDWNSMLPYYISAAGLVILRLPRALVVLRDERRPAVRRFIGAALLAALAVGFVLPRPLRALAGARRVHGDSHFAEVVSLARALPGRVVCPEDPTIPLLARGEITRSAFFEWDFAIWPENLPDYVAADVRAADYVIQVRGPFQWLVTDEWLEGLGFASAPEPTLDGSAYRLWRRAR